MPENVSRIEPCRLESAPREILDLLVELPATATQLGARLHPRSAASLAELVRVMNCYYSNLIEGHDTRPRDIERALASDFADDERKRNLQLEAAAHIRVQRKIDALYAEGALPEPASTAFLRELHRDFYRDAPESLLRIGDGARSFLMTPGEFRSRPEQEVAVGRHQPPSSGRVEEFMAYFADRFRYAGMSASERVLCLAIAHHRFNFIHPFPDGNGRVSRLMSHAMAHLAGLGAHGLWSVSRGLARGLESRTDYKAMMDLADRSRENDLDGRGNLSLRALQTFVKWFLSVCLDQLRFMSGLFEFDTLSARLGRLADRDELGPGAPQLLRELLARGEMARGELPAAAQLPARTTRRTIARLEERGLIASGTPKGPISLRFPVAYADALFPALFPQT